MAVTDRESLQATRDAINALVAARQRMRVLGASRKELESNRLELLGQQRQLSCALIELRLPGSKACDPHPPLAA